MMRCPNCGKNYPDNARFCYDCGTALEAYIPTESKGKKAVKDILKAICYTILFIAVQLLVLNAITTALVYADPCYSTYVQNPELLEALIDEKTAMLLTENSAMVGIISSLVSVLIVSLFFTFRKKNIFEEAMIRPVKWKYVPLSALYGVSLFIFVSVTIIMLPIPTNMTDAVDEQYDALFGKTNIILEILNTAFLAGLVEEIFFRGLVFSRLKRGIGRIGAVVVSAVLFGLCHGAFVAVCYAAFLGIVFAILTERRKSIVPGIICHIFFNASNYFLIVDDLFVMFAMYFVSIAVLLIGSYVLFKKDTAEE